MNYAFSRNLAAHLSKCPKLSVKGQRVVPRSDGKMPANTAPRVHGLIRSRLFLPWFLALLALGAQAETLTGKVIGIADGDTITVLDADRQQHKIRLAGIDAPEKAQAFGNRSRQNLAAMVFSRAVAVEWDKRDRYGRLVGKVLVNGVDANLEQIKAGLAWWYEKYRKEQSPDDQHMYAEAERQARSGRVGLWSDPAPVAPWEWRKGQR